jgi:transposase-like protein
MKSFNQILEQRLHRTVRAKVRACTQPGTVWNIIESEMSMFFTDVLQEKLREEQDALLQRRPYQRGGDGRKRNGFKTLRLKGLFRKIVLKRPVLRTATPESPIIKLFKSFGNGMVAMIASRFWLRGTSTRATAEEINRTFGTKITSSDVSKFSDSILPDVIAWLDRPITESFDYLYLDAIYLPITLPKVTENAALLCAIGLSKTGKRCVLGFLLGDRENDDSWTALIKDLLRRGLNRNSIALIISDEHKAILSAVGATLGNPHQLCIIHKMRNALCRVHGKHNRKEFYADFKAIYWAESKDDALRAMGRLETKWGKLYPKAVQIACCNPEAFLRFMDQPREFWTILRSTNLIERFNRELRRRLNAAGAMFGENELWKLAGTVAIEQEKRWDKRAFRKLKSVKELELAA